MPKPIKISDDVDLEKLLTRVSDDIVKAPAFLRFYKDLGAMFGEYKDEVKRSEFFWAFTRDAVREAALFRIARIYDQEKSALSLRTLLLTIQANPQLFKDEAVKKRVHHEYAKQMRPSSHHPRPKDIEAHLNIVSDSDPLVEKIIRWRNTLGAHISPKRLLKGPSMEFNPLTPDDAFSLCSRAYDVFNHYTSLFHGVSYARMIMGEEGSAERVFEDIREGVAAQEKRIEQELLRWQPKNADVETGQG